MSKTSSTAGKSAVNNPKTSPESSSKALAFLKAHQRQIIYLLIITFAFIPVYNHIFDKKVAQLGDNASYYILGKALADGDGYVNGHILGKPQATQFPPGYPAFIAAVMKIAGADFTTIKNANGVLLWLSLVILFFFFRNISKNIALSFVITLALVFNMHLLQYSTWMMSEIPFLFISSLSLLFLSLADLNKKPWQNPWFILTVITAAGAYYVRGQGLAVIVGLILFLLFERKWLHSLFAVVVYGALLLPWQMRNSGLPESPYGAAMRLKNYYNPSEGEMVLSDWFDRFFTNLERYLAHEIPSSVFSYVSDYQGKGVLFGGIILTAIILFGFIKLKKFRWAVGGYVLATLGILMLWPPIWYGIRFVLALAPIFTFLFAYGIFAFIEMIAQKMKVKNTASIQNGLPFAFLILILVFIGKLDDLNKEAKKRIDPLFRNYYAIAQWSKANLSDTAVVICRKPELFYLEADRYVEGFTKTEDMTEFLKSMERKKTTHLVVYPDGITQRFFFPVYEKNPEKFRIIQHLPNPDTYLIEYQPQFGYDGEWLNGVKEGKGTYNYPDGRKFIGNWKNNVQHGDGTLYGPNGEILANGRWENGNLNTNSN